MALGENRRPGTKGRTMTTTKDTTMESMLPAEPATPAVVTDLVDSWRKSSSGGSKPWTMQGKNSDANSWRELWDCQALYPAPQWHDVPEGELVRDGDGVMLRGGAADGNTSTGPFVGVAPIGCDRA